MKDNLEVRMRRAGLCAAFSLLVPGPKMIWQFGELGYDYSINQNEDGKFHDTDAGGYRTANKPIRWDYYDDGVEGEGEDEIRRGLYDTYSKLLAFRKKNSAFYDYGAGFRWYVSENEWPGRYMFIDTPDGSAHMAVFGNFGSGVQNISVELPHGGTWYNAFTGDQWTGSNHTCPMEEGKFYVLVDNENAVLNWNPGSDPVPGPGTDPAPDPDPTPDPGTGGETPDLSNRTLYLDPWQWTSDGARIEAYFFGGSGDAWATMTLNNGLYECEVPAGHTNVIFVRMDPTKPEHNWDSKWNQTEDLVIPTDKNCFTITSWDGGVDSKSTGTWSVK